MKLHKTIFILIIILFASFEKKISELGFEKKVMAELLPSLIDSTCNKKWTIDKVKGTWIS